MADQKTNMKNCKITSLTLVTVVQILSSPADKSVPNGDYYHHNTLLSNPVDGDLTNRPPWKKWNLKNNEPRYAEIKTRYGSTLPWGLKMTLGTFAEG